MKTGAAAVVGAILARGGSPATAAAAPEPIPAPKPTTKDLRLATFAPTPGASPRVGAVLATGQILDLGEEAKRRSVELSFDATKMLSLIAGGEAALQEVRKLIDGAKADGPMVEKVQLFAPIPTPERNVYAVGWNYVAHFEEGKEMRLAAAELPEHPVFFTKGSHTVNGPYGTIPYDPKVSTMIDWEGELAIIIGKRGKNISEDHALSHVFGFTVINDTTARDLQQKKHGGQWFKGKSLDGHGPMGPWIVTAGEIPWNDLHLITRVNGVVKQDSSTKFMYFNVPRIVSELSLGLTIEPGDIIATGTPPGVGYARKPPEFLKPGDVMETEIVGIGTIRNIIAAG